MEHIPDDKKINQYEQGHGAYEQLGVEKEKGWDSWGNVIVESSSGEKERDSFYSSEKITQRLFTQTIEQYLVNQNLEVPRVLVDFGGAEGLLLSQVATQLENDIPGLQIKSVLIDADVSKLKDGKEKRPEIQSVAGSVFQIPLLDNSVDIGVSRLMIQYFPPASTKEGVENNQFTALKEMYRVMKPGSVLEVVWASVYDFEANGLGANILDKLWSHITWHRTFDNKEDPGWGKWKIDEEGLPIFEGKERTRSLIPGTVLAEYAKKCGFQVLEGGQVDWIEFRFTAEAVFSRFGVKEEEKKELIEEVFRVLKTRWGLDVIEWQGQNALRLPISKLVLTK
jgi:SAM-dependent methyltransferase